MKVSPPQWPQKWKPQNRHCLLLLLTRRCMCTVRAVFFCQSICHRMQVTRLFRNPVPSHCTGWTKKVRSLHFAPLKQWCGLRPSVLGQDRSETKNNRSWSCSWPCRSGVVKYGLVTLVVIMILKDTATIKYYSFSILCLDHHYCGDQQWRLLT